MSDALPTSNAALSKQAKEYEDARDFARAAELYLQIFANEPKNTYAISHYISCLRKLNRSSEAVDFGWTLDSDLRTAKYVHQAWSWAIYDHYFKSSENKDVDESVDGETSRSEDDLFKKMQSAAEYILQHTPSDDQILRRTIVFGICRAAKQRGKWQLVYNFAVQLDSSQLSRDPDQWNPMPIYEQWLYNVIKALFLLEQNEVCEKIAQQGLNDYPQNKHFCWWHAVATSRLGHQEEALAALKDLDKRYQEWFIREDIAKICEQLQRYDEAWLWYCKAASLPGDLKGRYKMIGRMSFSLRQLERWQKAYEHLQLASLLAEREHWEKSKAAQEFHSQIEQLQSHFSTQNPLPIYTIQNYHQLQRHLQKLWIQEIANTLPHRQGYIKAVNEEKHFGFIRSDNDDFHFSFRNLSHNLIPTLYMQVEFDVEESYDHKKQKNSFKAINIHAL